MTWCSTLSKSFFCTQISRFLTLAVSPLFLCLLSFNINAQDLQPSLKRHNLDSQWQTGLYKEKGLQLAPLPKWVKTVELPFPAVPDLANLSDGIYHLVLDNQIRVTDTNTFKFNRYATKAVSAKGLQYISQITIDYDPQYQQVLFHGIKLYRNGDVIDKTFDSQFTLDKSDSANDLIYDGTLTGFWLINDVRLGDVIEYSYTLEGRNPVYRSNFSYQRSLQWSIPIHQQFLRILWAKSEPLEYKFHNTEKQFTVTKLGKETDYQVLQQDVPPLSVSSDAASWYSPYSAVEVSSYSNWESVVQWALPLFENQIDTSAAIAEKVNQIKQQTNDPKQQLILALKFVQNDIRYMGIEIGSNSHFPAKASETINKRYGDCKDKSVILIALLRALNIDSYAVLVNSQNGKALDIKLPSAQLFNHAIVKAELDNKVYWLDPTLLNQGVTLETLYQPDYGFGLVVKKGVNKLESLRNSQSGSTVKFEEYYDLSNGIEGPSSFKSTIDLQGKKARSLRARLDRNSITELSESYASYYNNIFNGVEISQPLTVNHSPNNGITTITEHYSLRSPWSLGDDDGYSIYFYESQISPYISMPEGFGTRDISLSHPLLIEGVITAKLRPQNWEFDPETIKENNSFFNFSFNVSFDSNTNELTLKYQYESKTDRVTSVQLDEYTEALAKLASLDSYGIVDFNNPAPVKPEETSSDLSQSIAELGGLIYWFIASALFAIGGLFTIASLLNEQSKQGNTNFYPISIKKFILLSLFSFGLYIPYWSYKNWQYIKEVKRPDIWPIARALFNPFWFYALFMWMEVDSEQRDKRSWLIPTWAAGFCFFSLLIYNGLNNRLDLAFITFIIPIALFLPLVKYANKVNGKDSLAYLNNSKIFIRNWIFITFASPLIIMMIAQEVNLIASDDVIEGKKLWGHDIHFMQQHKMIQQDSIPIYFYSESFFNQQTAGNGFTHQEVFSYWTEEQQLQWMTAKLSLVKDITVEYSNSETEDTEITVILNDDEEFLLFVTAVSGQDKTFVEELLRQWKANQITAQL